MQELTGQVQSIIFRNSDNGYSVLSLETDRGVECTVCGVLPLCSPGDSVVFQGEYKLHPRYGQQFAAVSCQIMAPSSLAAVEKYLSDGNIKGIGPAMAKIIVQYFGMDTLSIMENEPIRLMEIPGIGQKKYQMIADSFRESRAMRNILLSLEPYGVTLSQAYKLYKQYGDLALLRIQENPYQLIEDVEGIGFMIADTIAQKVAGFESSSAARLFAGLRYALKEACQEYGHTYLPKDKLLQKTQGLLGVEQELLSEALEAMLQEGRLSQGYVGEQEGVFLPYLFKMEQRIARRLLELSVPPVENPFYDVERYQKELGISLSFSQVQAVEAALQAGLFIITGGPGTGKTTIIRFITYAFEEQGLDYALCAPTGRAAKRMSEATGSEAYTIHRLLEYNPSEGFTKNQEEPLEVDAIIVDELSMVDVPLFFALLKALPKGTRLILVGDADQLPPVGCGDVLQDMLQSAVLPSIRLTEIFRQAQSSRIVRNAHLIHEGQQPVLSMEESDFIFESQYDPETILQRVQALCLGSERKLGTADPLMDVQVLAPMKKGVLGVENLNKVLQAVLNPPSLKKSEYSFGFLLLREGDKVMQIKNDYKIEWEKPTPQGGMAEGCGIFNGDLGTLYRLDVLNRSMDILFDDGRLASYDFTQADELDLAYCISIHKSQGSEFPVVILPLLSGPPMLLNRNLLYTAITRAKKQVYAIGKEETVTRMVRTVQSRRRFTSLKYALQEAEDSGKES